MENAFRNIIVALGENPTREGLAKTPARAAKAMQELCSGYQQTLDEVVNGAIFTARSHDMVIVKNIELYSLCEHHLLPFVGHCHVAYIPDQKIIGLSKIARIVDMHAKRLQIQETLTHDIAHSLKQAIQPLGVAVTIEAEHLCVRMQGVGKQNSQMLTSCMLGSFRSDARTRNEYLSLIQASRS